VIISASRRTDIPAFYADWFFDGLKQGSVQVANPYNPRQVRTIDLSAPAVDGIVFWSKNPWPMLDRLAWLRDYAYYFQMTLNAYGEAVEPGVPGQREAVEAVRRLAGLIGAERVVWRYDPIVLSDRFTSAYHLEHFGELAGQLSGLASQCTISFVDAYRCNTRPMARAGLRPPDAAEMRTLATGLAMIAREYRLPLQTCAEAVDYSDLGITHASCVAAGRIRRLSGRPLQTKPDKNQRPACGCSASVDIGSYNTCGFGCVYCYANARGPGRSTK
jgi:hypothetical protein